MTNTIIRRTILFILFVWYLCSCTPAYSQKTIDTYTASNGITYHAGDTVKLGRGSAPNGSFIYVQMGMVSPEGIGRNYSGVNVIIKRIKQYKFKGSDKVYFVVGGGNIVNYNLYIEDAIDTCEIECK